MFYSIKSDKMEHTVFLLANGKIVPGFYAALFEILHHNPDYKVVAKLVVIPHVFKTLATGERVIVQKGRPKYQPGGVVHKSGGVVLVREGGPECIVKRKFCTDIIEPDKKMSMDDISEANFQYSSELIRMLNERNRGVPSWVKSGRHG